jgi:hypothetical protein
MAHYLVTRPDVFHTAPLAVMVALLGAWALAPTRAPGGLVENLSHTDRNSTHPPEIEPISPARRTLATLTAAVVVLSLAYTAIEGLDRRWLDLRTDYEELRLPAADGVNVRAERRDALEGAVRAVQARVPPGEPIYVATRRSDLVTSGDPLFYVLAHRPNPTRYDIQAPGVITTAPVQREIVRDLKEARPRAIVRFTAAVTAAPEPNRAGESTGVTVLDDYLERAYRPTKRFGPYLILSARRTR